MRRADDLDGLVRIVDPGQRHVQVDGELESARTGREQFDPGSDGGVVCLHLLPAPDGPEGALEAGRVAGGEELLGIRTSSLAAELLRHSQVYLELSVRRVPVACRTAARDFSLRRV